MNNQKSKKRVITEILKFDDNNTYEHWLKTTFNYFS